MDNSTHNKIVGFIWSVADDLLRDVYQRGKYHDVILPFTVLRRLDCLLESEQDRILDGKDIIDPRFTMGVPTSSDRQLLIKG